MADHGQTKLCRAADRRSGDRNCSFHYFSLCRLDLGIFSPTGLCGVGGVASTGSSKGRSQNFPNKQFERVRVCLQIMSRQLSKRFNPRLNHRRCNLNLKRRPVSRINRVCVLLCHVYNCQKSPTRFRAGRNFITLGNMTRYGLSVKR